MSAFSTQLGVIHSFTFQHCCNSYCDIFTCHSCRIVNECKVYEAEGAVGASAPASSKMDRAD